MKFTIDTAELVKAVDIAARGASSRSAIVAMGGVYLDATGSRLRLTCTDMEVAVHALAAYTLTEPGEALVSVKQLRTLLGTVSGEITLELTDGGVALRHGTTRLTLPSLPAADFPIVKTTDDLDAVCTLPSALLLELWETARRARGTDESRPVLTGIQIQIAKGQIAFVSTDSYRLAVHTAPCNLDVEFEAVVPGAALAEVARLAARSGPVQVSFTAPHIGFEVAGLATVVSRVIDGKFPNWRQLLPDDTSFVGAVDIDRAEAITAVERIVKLAGRRTSPLRLQANPGEHAVTFSYADGVRVESKVPAVCDLTDTIAIGLHPAFLLDALASQTGSRVRVRFIRPLRPIIVDTDGSPGRVLLMPVRLADTYTEAA